MLQSLKTLDPSFRITPNNQFGSDPNKLPDVNIRGKSSISNIESEWGDDPNRPLFILDGFEVDLQTIVDLSMDRIASVNVLKDAASTAMYGSVPLTECWWLKRLNQNRVNCNLLITVH